MRHLTQILFLLIFQIIISYSQVSLQWERAYNGPANNQDTPVDILTDNNKNVYTAGNSKNSNQTSDYDIAIVKYDSVGTLKWSSRFNNARVSKCVLDPSGNLYAAGWNSQGQLIVKFDLNGSVLWTKSFNSANSIFSGFYDIKIDNNGYIFVSSNKSDTLFVVKLNSSGTIIWTTNYINANYHHFSVNKLNFDISGNILVCGIIAALTNNGGNSILLKFNSSGVIQWSDIFNWQNQSDDWYDMFMDQNANIYVSGSVQDNLLVPHAIIRKYNTSGNILWTVIDSVYSYANEIKQDNLNNIFVSGYWDISSSSYGSGVKKYNSNGTEQWVRIQTFSHPEFSDAMLVDNHCNVYIGKSSPGANTGNAYTKVIKYNSNGDSLWNIYKQGNSYSGTWSGGAYLTNDEANNIYLATTGLGVISLNDYYTLKYSQSGFDVSGTVTYKDNSQPVSGGFAKVLYYDKSTATIITMDSTIINSNGTYTFTHFPPHDSVDIMYYQNDDNLDFVPTYYPSTIDWKQAVKIYATQNLTGIDGQVYRINNTTNPYSINGQCTQNINLDNTGALKDAIVYAKIGSEFKNYGVSLSSGNYVTTKLPAGNYTLTAYRMGFDPVTQNVTITNNSLSNINFNFGSPIGIQPISNEIPTKFKLYQNYPNPFNPSTTIKFDIPKDDKVKIVIYDIMGREVNTLADENLKAGTYNIKWDASNYASGIYFYRIETNSFNDTKKLILMK